MTWLDRIHVGDCRALMRDMIAAGVRVDCIVTSPPYWGLRDYGVGGQIGLERTWLRHVARMRGVFRTARGLLADDGVMWLNLGDSYAGSGGQSPQSGTLFNGRTRQRENICLSLRGRGAGLKEKDLVGMPWRIAFALQADGWYLRSDIVWSKPNPMPESVTDRPTKGHEYVFLMSKSPQYHYDAAAIAEPGTGLAPGNKGPHKYANAHAEGDERHRTAGGLGRMREGRLTRNTRTVWSIASSPFRGSHFATFPRELVRRCVLAGSKPGGVVFDPFMGSGTVAEVALSLGRHFVGCELNPEYAAMFETHRSQQRGLAV